MKAEVIDAALISAAQRVEHYEIAAYGCLITYAQTLGHDDAAGLLKQTLSEEEAADEKLSQLAEGGSIRPLRQSGPGPKRKANSPVEPTGRGRSPGPASIHRLP